VERTAGADSRSYGIFLESPADLAAAGEQVLQIGLILDSAKGWMPAMVEVPQIDAILAAKMAAEKAEAREGDGGPGRQNPGGCCPGFPQLGRRPGFPGRQTRRRSHPSDG